MRFTLRELAGESLKKTVRRLIGPRDLPLYILIGPPGAGKSTLVANSGLTHPLDQKRSEAAAKKVGGIRDCDWWFTDRTLLLDTAGRYTTQDGFSASDASGWGTFVQMLRKHRAGQPLNGVIVALSAVDLLTSTEIARDAQVKAVRRQLAQLSRQLQCDFPVYFLVTKCDLVGGFCSFFADLPEAARSQEWGVTFSPDASESGRAAALFASEVQLLLRRVQSRMIGRMQAERNPQDLVGNLAFPQQLTLLTSSCGDFLQRVWLSKFDNGVMLRGAYFTSATQEGTPIDPLLTSVQQTFGMGAPVTPTKLGPDSPFFLTRLLQQVILRDAGAHRRPRARKPALHPAAYVVCALVSLLVFAGLFASYKANAHYFENVSRAAAGLRATEPDRGKEGEWPAVFLPRLDALRAVVDAAENYQSDVPWSRQMGLYASSSLRVSARDAYVRELNRILPRDLTERFEQELRASVTAADDRIQLRKAYLMLGNASRRDPKFLGTMAGLEWRRAYPADEATARRLAEHFKQLFVGGDHLTAQMIDPSLLEHARAGSRDGPRRPRARTGMDERR